MRATFAGSGGLCDRFVQEMGNVECNLFGGEIRDFAAFFCVLGFLATIVVSRERRFVISLSSL